MAGLIVMGSRLTPGSEITEIGLDAEVEKAAKVRREMSASTTAQ